MRKNWENKWNTVLYTYKTQIKTQQKMSNNFHLTVSFDTNDKCLDFLRKNPQILTDRRNIDTIISCFRTREQVFSFENELSMYTTGIMLNSILEHNAYDAALYMI